jgi:hypothetical protein
VLHREYHSSVVVVVVVVIDYGSILRVGKQKLVAMTTVSNQPWVESRVLPREEWPIAKDLFATKTTTTAIIAIYRRQTFYYR